MKKKNQSYSQILKSTTIFGGSQLMVILIGIIRTKIVAMLLGTTGVGIIGIYYSVINMIRSAAGLGIDTAGVREVAEINSTGDETLLHKTVNRYNLWFLSTALIGLFLCIVFCYPISIWAFGNDRYTLAFAILSVCVFLAILTAGRSTLLQGMRRVSYLAKSNILSSLISLVVAVPIYFFFGTEAIVFAFLLTFLISFLCVEFYYRKLHIPRMKVIGKEAFLAGLKPLRLGIYIVIGAFISTVSLFVIRAFITRNLGIEAAGLFQSAWVITNIYLGLVLQSMGTDFFPRLSAIAGNENKVRELVNEQTYVALVVASPIIVAMILFSSIAISVLYSSEFSFADSILRWQVLGTFFKVLSWPMAFIMLAKNKGAIYLFSEGLYYVVYLLSAYLLYPIYGLLSAGIAFFIAYLVYLPVVFIIAFRLSAFRWNRDVVIMSLVNLVLVISTFLVSTYVADTIEGIILKCILMVVSLIYGYYNLRKIFNIADLKTWFGCKSDGDRK
mgnify:CR=1 FL=1